MKAAVTAPSPMMKEEKSRSVLNGEAPRAAETPKAAEEPAAAATAAAAS
jgi:small subunit ribosomal protein S6